MDLIFLHQGLLPHHVRTGISLLGANENRRSTYKRFEWIFFSRLNTIQGNLFITVTKMIFDYQHYYLPLPVILFWLH